MSSTVIGIMGSRYRKEHLSQTQQRIISTFTFSNIQHHINPTTTTITGRLHLTLKSYLVANAVVISATPIGVEGGLEKEVVLWVREGERLMEPREWVMEFSVEVEGVGRDLMVEWPVEIRLRAVVERPKVTAGDLAIEAVVEVEEYEMLPVYEAAPPYTP